MVTLPHLSDALNDGFNDPLQKVSNVRSVLALHGRHGHRDEPAQLRQHGPPVLGAGRAGVPDVARSGRR